MRCVVAFLLAIVAGATGCSTQSWVQREEAVSMIEGGRISRVVVARADPIVVIRNVAVRGDTLSGRARLDGGGRAVTISVADIDSAAVRVPNRSTGRAIAIFAVFAAVAFLASIPDHAIQLP